MLLLFVVMNYYNNEVELVFEDTEKNRSILKKCESLLAVSSHLTTPKPYVTTFYLPFRFMEIIYCTKFEVRPYVKIKEERLLTPEGEILELGETDVT